MCRRAVSHVVGLATFRSHCLGLAKPGFRARPFHRHLDL
jgi:hypothetical protein